METLSPATVPVRVTFGIADAVHGCEILSHLVEERLVAGGTVIHAEAVNWVGGAVTNRTRMEVTAYTTFDKLPLIRERLRLLGEDAVLSQFVMAGEKKEVLGWVERNVRS